MYKIPLPLTVRTTNRGSTVRSLKSFNQVMTGIGYPVASHIRTAVEPANSV